MKEIRIEKNDKVYYSIFNTQEELEAWKEKQTQKGLWNHSDIVYERDYEVSNYEELRAVEYKKIDDLLKEALVEKELGNSEKWDEYILLRDAIKEKYPKA
jgi:hypothetical protein